MSKTCSRCHEAKPEDGFYASSGRQCKACISVLRKEYREGPAREGRLAYLREYSKTAAYGLTREQLDALFTAQAGACAVCHLPLGDRFDVDHDHSCCPGHGSCGKCVRGLLHRRCNQAVGWLEQLMPIPGAIERLMQYAGVPDVQVA